MDFEKLLDRIKEITVKLEDENTGIEESFKLFEEGLKLSEEGANMLSAYSARFDKLKEKWTEILNRADG